MAKAKEESKELAVAQPPGQPAIVEMRSQGIQGHVDSIEVLEADDTMDETGLENVGADERRVPILRILDPKSPQCKPVERGGLGPQGAGMIYNTSTGEVYDGKAGLYFVAAMNDRKFVKYKKRNDDGSGGGFLAIYEPEDPFVEECKQRTLEEHGSLFRKWTAGEMEDGTPLELVDTRYLACEMIKPNPDGSFPGEHGELFAALLPFASTQIKKHQAFIERNKNMMYNFRMRDGTIKRAPGKLWGHVWHLSTVYEERGSQSWYGWKITLAAKDEKGMELPYKESRLSKDSFLYRMAEDLRSNLLEGSTKIDYEKDTADQTGDAGAGPGSAGNAGAGEDIPFDNQ